MKIKFKGKYVKTNDILTAIHKFDAQYPDSNSYDAWLENETYKYAVQHGGKLYPCKYILSQATGIDTSKFNGGSQTNSVFHRLGFRVIHKQRTKARK